MDRQKRARHIRDMVLRQAGLSIDESLALTTSRIVSTHGWRVRLSRSLLAYTSTPRTEATKLDLWVDCQKVAVMAWSQLEFWIARMDRGDWETAHFGLPPYRNSSERWLDICNDCPTDQSILQLMKMVQLSQEGRVQSVPALEIS